ncbi:protein kinase, ATP binding site-containing protein [Tanacetum coccineum]
MSSDLPHIDNTGRPESTHTQMPESNSARSRATASTSTKCSRHYQKLEDLLIPLTEISLATGDFSKDSQIGDGGFGVVHIGRLSDRWQNHEAAIKRLDNNNHQGKKEFLNELRLISRFHHQNIISFIGYCDEGDEMILVYEYASNGSLDHHLQDPNKRHQLPWSHRIQYALIIAKPKWATIYCASTIEALSSSSGGDSDTYPNEDTLTIKAEYRDDLIAFHIPPSSATLAALKKESMGVWPTTTTRDVYDIATHHVVGDAMEGVNDQFWTDELAIPDMAIPDLTSAHR